MNVDESTEFVRCRTCGRYVNKSDAHYHNYCSDACTVQYARCVNCGRYFERSRDGQVAYCSSDCAAVYEVPIKPRIRGWLKEAS